MWHLQPLLVILACTAPITKPQQHQPESLSKVIYAALAPKIIRPYSTYQVSITIEQDELNQNVSPVLVQLAIVSNATTHYKSESVSVKPGSSQLVPIQIGALVNDKHYNLTIDGHQETSLGSGLSVNIFKDVSTVHVQKKTSCVFIQTDKVIYKPGETVKFRVVVLDRELKPFPAAASEVVKSLFPPTVNILILDSRRNVIKSWKQQPVFGGLYSDNLTLSAEPVLGDWSIEVNVSPDTANSAKIHSFSVDQYILPKFNVEVILPPFTTFNDSKITAQVKATYTYGKSIGNGEAIVTISTGNRHYQTPSPVVSKTIKLNSGVAFVEFELVKELSLAGDWERKVKVEASVVETLTGRRQNGTSSITIYRHPFKLALMPGAENYKPGFLFNVTIKVTTQDDVPVHDDRPDALIVKHGFSYTDEGSIFKSSIPLSGLVSFTFKTPSNELLNIHGFEGSYKGVTQWFSIPEKITSESKTYIELVIVGENREDSVHVGQELSVSVTSNKPFRSLNYQLVGSGQLLNHGKQVNPTPSTTSLISVKIPQAAAPTATLVVYVVSTDETHEVIADSIQINTENVLNNYLNVTLSNSTLEPGESVQLTLDSKPSSLIALRGVDQSVLLLKEDKDIDLNSVNEELKRFGKEDYHYYGGGSYASRVFTKAGLVILTNAKIHKPATGYYPHYHVAEQVAFDSDIRPAAVHKFSSTTASFAAGLNSNPSRPPPRVRKHFPETWLWEEVHDLAQLNKTVPDTLTSWIITGFSIHSDFGLGIIDKAKKLTVVRPFFVTLNVPYSAVKGEVLAVQVLVHNYQDREQEAKIRLDNSKGQFIFVEQQNQTKSSADEGKYSVKTVVVGRSDVGTVTFVIIPNVFGTIELAVKGTTDFAGDALSKPLIVKPPGQQQTVNKVALLDHRSKDASKILLETSFPKGRVLGADTVRMSTVSDILGPTISNLDDLLKMPYGCGEQNMVNFVPDIVILDYLTAVNSLTPDIKTKAIKYLESGYQRQLTYVHDDGSFSSFGKSDKDGSTWLTAFVIKSFAGAKPYITIDDTVIARGLEFLSQQQVENGTFLEPGRVLHSGLQGGSSKGLALTAYTLLTFIELTRGDENRTSKYQPVMDKALSLLTSQFATDSRDTYALALTTYALELANHPKKEYFSSLIESQANVSTDGELKHWEQPPEPKVIPSTTTTTTSTAKPDGDRIAVLPPIFLPVPTVPKTKPVSVEMTSYQLLTYIHQSKVAESLPIVKWLLTKRNAEGGFISTQDTVVGLAALAKFAALTSGTELNLVIVAKYGNESRTININKDNSIVLQQFELPTTTNVVEFETTGKGMALVQLTNIYYVESTEATQAFKVDVEVTSPKVKELKLSICTHFNRNDKTPSNMAVLEVNLPTGYAFDTEKLEQVKAVSKVMRIDTSDSDTKVDIYFDSLNSDESCVELYADLIFRVAKQSPSYVLTYDYYDTTKNGKAIYESPQLDFCEVECADEAECKHEKVNCI